MRKFSALIVALTMALFSMATSAKAATFTFEDYFAGRSVATGSFSAINGVKRSFKVNLTGTWNGKMLTLREDFTYDDGEIDTKTWRFTKTGPNTYSGTREDVIGQSLVTLKGNKARFTYLVYLDSKGKKNKVRFHDTMTLRPDGSVINVATVTKFGLPVAKTRVEFTRP